MILLVLFFTVINVFSHEDTTELKPKQNVENEIAILKSKIDEMSEIIREITANIDEQKKLKISGYVQAQFQSAQQSGISSFAGGNFPNNMHNRFNIRRGRLKFDYKNKFTDFNFNEIVFQIDITEKGLGVKDAFLKLNEEWIKAFSLSAGIFNRPFGYEIGFSSGNRESPERSRVIQSLFPNERDLGIAVTFRPDELSPIKNYNFIELTTGIFAGNGTNQEFDNFKDIIGRLGFSLPLYKLHLALDFGLSHYSGNILVPESRNVFYINDIQKATKDSVTKQTGRKYYGLDIEVYYDLPVIGGFSIKGEYVFGKQPGTKLSNSSFTNLPSSDIYLRDFNGFYLTFVQNLGRYNQFILKYDVYDPNTSVSGSDIGRNPEANHTGADIKYSTIGIGFIHYWDANLKLVFYYDFVKNETTEYLSDYSKKLKENVFTFRIQYKF